MTAVRGRDHTNNLDALRVFAALMVIHGHGWALSGAGNSGLWGVPFGRVGLDVFFSISGYLVTASWTRAPTLGSFLIKRGIRIFPGLIACVLTTVLVLGPGMTSLSPSAYFASPQTAAYLGNIVLFNELYLPGVFTGMAEGGAVNGSLWSLLPEFLCYLTVPLFALVATRWRAAALVAAALLCGATGLFLFYGGWSIGVIYHLDPRYALVEAPFFLVGAALYFLDRQFGERLWRTDLCLMFFCGNYLISAYLDWWNLPFEWLTLPYMVLAFGRMSLPVLSRMSRFGDFSYGLYLYAFPVQQAVLAIWPTAPYPVMLCTALTLVLAALSWHLVEKPALRGRRLLAGSAAAEQAAKSAPG